MVNISKRMHKLMPRIWHLTSGPGAAVLPSDPAKPQLTSIVLRIPNITYKTNFDTSGRIFLRKYLHAFKYHNFTIPIMVEQKKSPNTSLFAPTLTLTFKAASREALEAQYTQPEHSDHEEIVRLRELINTGSTDENVARDEKKRKRLIALKGSLDGITVPEGCGTLIGSIMEKSQDTTSSSQSVTSSLLDTVYERTIKLGLRARKPDDIWKWFTKLTGAEMVPVSDVEKERKQEHAKYAVQANKDRALTRAGMEKLREEKEHMRKVKEAAEKLAAEA